MPLAQSSILVSIICLILYILGLYFISKSFKYRKILMGLASIVFLAFISYYNLKFYKKLNNDNLLQLVGLVKIMIPLSFLPYLIGIHAYFQSKKFPIKGIYIFLVEVLFILLTYYLWQLCLSGLYLGSI
ncbi:hypothetical protein OZX68_03300 [Streptococcaceae bacterium ESL0729]|nr:hypothetical protein OZX68_03300 [Streptococcaceae bacterium ESL0729]